MVTLKEIISYICLTDFPCNFEKSHSRYVECRPVQHLYMLGGPLEQDHAAMGHLERHGSR